MAWGLGRYNVMVAICNVNHQCFIHELSPWRSGDGYRCTAQYWTYTAIGTLLWLLQKRNMCMWGWDGMDNRDVSARYFRYLRCRECMKWILRGGCLSAEIDLRRIITSFKYDENGTTWVNLPAIGRSDWWSITLSWVSQYGSGHPVCRLSNIKLILSLSPMSILRDYLDPVASWHRDRIVRDLD